MADLFKEVIPSILQTKENVFESDPTYKSYLPYMVNKALSAHYDCILYVNEMNLRPQLPKDVQYKYFINTIRPSKRKFQPWLKNEKFEDLELVQEYYSCSLTKAKDILPLLSDDQMDYIKEHLDKGGIKE